MQYFEVDVFPHIGNRPIKELRVSDIKNVIEHIAERGALETAEKIRQWIGSVFNHAALLELTDGNPAALLVGYLPKRQAVHMPALPREELTEFFRRLILADTHQQNRLCVMLIMLCFARNAEIRGGRWQEIDFDKKTWTIPAERILSRWQTGRLNYCKSYRPSHGIARFCSPAHRHRRPYQRNHGRQNH